MKYIITPPEHINTCLTLPASKSISNRALIIQALSNHKGKIQNLSSCDDTTVMVNALKDESTLVDIKAAGSAMRFLTAFYSIDKGEHILTGSERMKQRPIDILVDALHYLGADIQYLETEGYPPLHIKGKHLEGGEILIPGNVSSQYISALLMIAPLLDKGLIIRLKGKISSRPYIDLTLHIMHQYGIQAEWSDFDSITVPHQEYSNQNYYIENDWTAASYWYEILALSGDMDNEISLPGLLDSSRQGDAAVKYIFSLLGVKTKFNNVNDKEDSTAILTRHNRVLSRLEYDFTNQPDLAQTLIALCPTLDIPFYFTGLESLKIKETDRIQAMQQEMAKLGFVLKSRNNSEVSWNGEKCSALPNPVIETYEDHRMAMSFAPLAIKYGSICIHHPEVVSKSYPDFWNHLQVAGFNIHKIKE